MAEDGEERALAVRSGAVQEGQDIGRQFIDAVCDVMGLPEKDLFYAEGGSKGMAGRNGKTPKKTPAKRAAATPSPTSSSVPGPASTRSASPTRSPPSSPGTPSSPGEGTSVM